MRVRGHTLCLTVVCFSVCGASFKINLFELLNTTTFLFFAKFIFQVFFLGIRIILTPFKCYRGNTCRVKNSPLRELIANTTSKC